MRTDRLSKHEYFFKICSVVAERSTCRKRQVGAIIVKNGMIISTGYNGAAKGSVDCLTSGCLRDNSDSGTDLLSCRASHAEMNAIVQAAANGANITDADMYTSTMPCDLCLKLIINSGIKRVFYLEDYKNHLLLDELKNLIELNKIVL